MKHCRSDGDYSSDSRVLTSDTAISDLTNCTTTESETNSTATNVLITCEENSIFESAELRTIFGLYHSDAVLKPKTSPAHLITPEIECRDISSLLNTKSTISGEHAHFYGRVRSLSSLPMDSTRNSTVRGYPRGNMFQSSRDTFRYGEYTSRMDRAPLYNPTNSAGM